MVVLRHPRRPPCSIYESPRLRDRPFVSTALSGLLSLFQDERDRQVDLVADDVAVLDQHVLVLDPSTLNVPEGAGGTLDGHVNRVLKALIGGGTQLCYASYAHKALLLRLAFPESF